MLAVSVPSGFTDTLIAANLTGPAALDVAGDGRVFFTDQAGHIRIIQNDVHLPTPFADLSLQVDSSGEHGMLGIALDPNFASNRHVYVYYTASSPQPHNRLSRLTADAANPNLMLPGSELPLMDFPSIGSAIWHMGGSIQFGPDERLYIAIGDHQNGVNSQSLNTVLGKILRVNADGTIPADNPFYTQTTGINRAIWALGLRNPFTTAFQPGTGRFYINDVGQDTWEEINEGIVGANYGWPGTEGDFIQSSFPQYTRPVYSYQHINGRNAITGGTFYNPATATFPLQYVGKYFFMDFGSGEIWTLDPQTKAVAAFASGLVFPNGMDVGDSGILYYLQRGADTGGQPNAGTGSLHKIQFSAALSPTISSPPLDTLVSVGYPATFSVGASGSSPLSYQWTRDGQDIPGANSSTYSIASTTMLDNGTVFRVRVSNSVGQITSAPATLTVTTNVPPVASIAAPPAGASYRAGDTIQFSGSGFDAEDGVLPASQMTWRVDFHHHEHLHPFFPNTSGSGGQFTIPTSGETSPDVWYRIHLTVTDSIGLQHEVYRDVTPITANLTIKTNVPGLQIRLDGQPHTAPYAVQGVGGMIRTVEVVGSQSVNGQAYEFVGWSDGGAATHSLVFPDTDTVLTAHFAPLAIAYLSDLPFAQTPSNGWGPVERDRSNGETGAADGQALTLNGAAYTKGLGTHANSDVRFSVAGTGYTEFRADIGVDDEAGSGGSVIFQVWIDSVKAYESPLLTGASATQSIVVPIPGGAGVLRLVVADGANGNTSDHADWADARLISLGGAVVTPVFYPAVGYSTGLHAHGLTVADFNGDGKPDLAVANAGNNTVTVRFGNGDGTFGPAASYGVGAEPKSVAAGDLNGDGKPDLVTANQGPGTVSVLLNAGDGSYFQAVSYAATPGAHEAALADLDGDGDLDIAVTGWGASLLRVMFNNGNGAFAAGTTYAVGAAPHSVVAADFNGDGRPDLAVANRDSNSVAVLINLGAGTFQSAAFHSVGAGPHSIRFGDLNGDGKTDLATADEGAHAVSVLLGTGAGGFSSAVHYPTGLVPKGIALGDVNGDGKLDLLTANTAGNYPNSNNPGGDTISLLTGNGDGTFASPQAYTTGRTPFSIALADLDGDGDLDAISANWHTDNAAVLLNATNDGGPNQNASPTAVADSITTPAGHPAIVPVLGNDFDVDGTIDPTSVSILTQPAHGAATVNPVTGVISYVPDPGYAGPDEFFYTVDDDQGATSLPARVSITITSAQAQAVYLSDLNPASAQNGWGAYERDRSNGESGAADGRTITLNGVTYPRGLGVHALSDLRYNLSGTGYSEFRADIGIDDEIGSGGSVVFQVWVDGALFYTSPTMTAASVTQTISVPISGATQLRLVVTDAGNGNTNDHADWASARLLTSALPPVVSINSLATNDPTPALTGTVSDPVAGVVVTIGGYSFAAINHGDGTWTLADDAITPPLANGTYDVKVSAAGATGSVGADLSTDELVIDTVPPLLVNARFVFETGQSLEFDFSEAIASSLVAGDLELTNLTTGQVVDPATVAMVFDPSTRTARFTCPGLAAGTLPDGNYRARIAAGAIEDAVGNAIAADAVLEFFVLAGDANRDRVVDITDLGILATNWQDAGKTFSQGDFNYDGAVDITDLGILASNWQTSLPQANPAAVSTESRLPARKTQRRPSLPRRTTNDIRPSIWDDLESIISPRSAGGA